MVGFCFILWFYAKKISSSKTRGTSKKIFAKIETVEETFYQEEGWKEVGVSFQVRQGGAVLITPH